MIHYQFPILRHHIDHQNTLCSQPEKNLYVYDKVVTDFPWWVKQEAQQNHMISVLKENSVAIWIESIAFDANNSTNTGIEDYSIVENQGVKFNVVHYRDPETQKLHRFVSTLPQSINPGTIAILYYKRWSIEKAYNNSKSNLKEKKAWSSSVKSLNNQMRLTTMTYNLMRVCEEISKIQDPELIHPSDKKYNKALEKRQRRALKRGGFVNILLFLKRIACISSYTIRAVQNSIITGKSLVDLMSALMSRLVPSRNNIGTLMVFWKG